MARSFDLIIKNGRVLDGTGSPYFKGDIGIKNSKLESNRLYMVNGILKTPPFYTLRLTGSQEKSKINM
jgi:hypothetical protein